MIDSRSEKKFLETSYGQIAYLETGRKEKPTVLFVHGIPTSSFLWRHVIRLLQNDFHCLAPDLMGLGDTDADPEKTPFHMQAQAEMLAEFMEKLGHEKYSLVCHDQGGAASQILATTFPERIVSWVITDSVCYDNWPVPVIARLQSFSKLPIIPDIASRYRITEWLEAHTPISSFKRGVYDPSKFSNEAIAEYLRPLRESEKSRKRFMAFLLAGHERYTLGVVPALQEFNRPTLILWGGDDRYISPSWGWKLYEDIPGAERFELIPFCGHFWQEEKPAEYTSKIGKFIAEKTAIAQETAKSNETAKPRETPKKATQKAPPKKKPTAPRKRAPARG